MNLKIVIFTTDLSCCVVAQVLIVMEYSPTAEKEQLLNAVFP